MTPGERAREIARLSARAEQLNPEEEARLGDLVSAVEEDHREADWFEFCVRKANQHDSKTVLHQIWWSLRMEDLRDWSMEDEGPMVEWAKYLDYKIEDQCTRP